MQFFPGPVFAWSFLAVLAALTAAMAVIDLRTAIIPKKLTLATLAAGVVAHMIRCALLSGQDRWLFETDNPLVGVMEGLLYASISAVLAFAIMFVLWILGACGGGDVKLMTGVGAWVGYDAIGYVILVSVLVLMAFLAFRILTGQVRMSEMKKMTRAGQNANLKYAKPNKPLRTRTTYSLPIFIAAMTVMLFAHRVELGLDTPKAKPTQVQNNEIQ